MARGTHANPTTLSGNVNGSGAPTTSTSSGGSSTSQQKQKQKSQQQQQQLPGTASTTPTDASAHAGFVNLGNTCFLNSVLQATSATRSLQQLYQPEWPTTQDALALMASSAGSLPPLDSSSSSTSTASTEGNGSTAAAAAGQQRLHVDTSVTSLALERSRSPVLALADEEHGRTGPFFATASSASFASSSSRRTSVESQQQQQQQHTGESLTRYQPSAADLPLNTAFRQVLERTWDTRPFTVSSSASSFSSSSAVASSSSLAGGAKRGKAAPINPKKLLNIMTSKYEQYGDYGQQDGHELLRHLLDSLRMEEVDVIKKMRPPSSSSAAASSSDKKNKRKTKRVKGQNGEAIVALSAESERGKEEVEEEKEEGEAQMELVPFVDNLFCGKLLSCVVCEGCRHVSHTYEDFYDLSLPLRGDPPEVALRGARKRDRIRLMADRWRKATGGSKSAMANRPTTTSEALAAGILSDTSGSGAMSETEDHAEIPTIKARSLSRGRSISRPKSAGASIDMSGTAKDDLKRALKSDPASSTHDYERRDGASTPTADDIDLERLNLDDAVQSRKHRGSQSNAAAALLPSARAEKQAGGSAAALLRAVSGRSRPGSRAASPMSQEIEAVVSGSSPPFGAVQEPLSPQTPKSHHHLGRAAGGKSTGAKQQSRQGAYLAKLLAEQPQVPLRQPITTSATAALLWGRRTQAGAAMEAPGSGSSTPIAAVAMTPSSSAASHQDRDSAASATEAPPPPSEYDDMEAKQAGTGLVKALNAFTAVEVLDGANSFACKRCWRRLNPPTAAERETLVRRRLRRGKREDESEESSDDETSSDSDGEGETRRVSSPSTTKKKTKAIDNGNRSFKPVVLVSRPTSQTSNGGSTSDLGEGTTMIVDDVETPSTAVSLGLQNSSAVDKGSTPNNGAVDPQSSAPKLKAPRPVMAGSSGITLGPSNYSSSGYSSDGGPSTTSGEEDGGPEDEIVRVTSKPSIQFLDQDPPSRPVTAPIGAKSATTSSTTSALNKASDAIAPNGLRRKRSTQSLQRRALKRFLIASTPRVLVFHFKRFQATGYGRNGANFKKIDDAVSFPALLDVKPWLAPPREEYDRHGRLKSTSDPRALEEARLRAEAQMSSEATQDHHHHFFGHHHHRHHILGHGHGSKTAENEHGGPQDQTRFDLPEGPSTKYRLYAVVVHQGSMSGGHYVAYVLSDRCNLPASAATATPTIPNKPVPSSSSSIASSSSVAEVGMTTAAGNRSSSTSSRRQSNDSAGDYSESSLGPDVASENGRDGNMHSNGNGNGHGTGVSASTAHHGQQQQQQPKRDDRRWIYASDTTVRPATLEEVLKAQAYMLFYEQL